MTDKPLDRETAEDHEYCGHPCAVPRCPRGIREEFLVIPWPSGEGVDRNKRELHRLDVNGKPGKWRFVWVPDVPDKESKERTQRTYTDNRVDDLNGDALLVGENYPSKYGSRYPPCKPEKETSQWKIETSC